MYTRTATMWHARVVIEHRDFPLNLVKDPLNLDIRLSPTFDTLKRRLKTHLFKIVHQNPYHAAQLVTPAVTPLIQHHY